MRQGHKLISKMSLTDIAVRSIAFELSLIELVVFKQDENTLDTVSIDPEEDVIRYEINFVWEIISFTAHALR